MIARLLCWLGWHAWMGGEETDAVRVTAGDPLVWCARCGKRGDR